MTSGPGLPRFDLRRGPWRAEVYDPRANPLALGSRYVHGGYIHSLWRGDRCLTGNATLRWSPDNGGGMPETFDTDFAAAYTEPGDTYMRIGVGRIILERIPRRALYEPDLAVHWQLTDRGEDWLTMRCQDEVRRRGRIYGYELERTVRLHDDGLESLTTLMIDCPSNHQVSWYPHPFWTHDRCDHTAYRLPRAALLTDTLSRGDDGLTRLAVTPSGIARGEAHGLWGHFGDIECHFSPARGGGVMRLELDKPWDHVVVWASTCASSVEPQLSRVWPRRERAGWTLRYRWIG